MDRKLCSFSAIARNSIINVVLLTDSVWIGNQCSPVHQWWWMQNKISSRTFGPDKGGTSELIRCHEYEYVRRSPSYANMRNHKKRIEWYNLFSSIKSNKIPEEYWKMCACMRGAWMFTPHGNLRTLHWAAERRNFMTTQFRQIYCILLSLWTHIFFYDLLTDSWCGLSDDFIITYFFVRPLCCWRHEFWRGEWWSMQQRWITRKKM